MYRLLALIVFILILLAIGSSGSLGDSTMSIIAGALVFGIPASLAAHARYKLEKQEAEEEREHQRKLDEQKNAKPKVKLLTSTTHA